MLNYSFFSIIIVLFYRQTGGNKTMYGLMEQFVQRPRSFARVKIWIWQKFGTTGAQWSQERKGSGETDVNCPKRACGNSTQEWNRGVQGINELGRESLNERQELWLEIPVCVVPIQISIERFTLNSAKSRNLHPQILEFSVFFIICTLSKLNTTAAVSLQD